MRWTQQWQRGVVVCGAGILCGLVGVIAGARGETRAAENGAAKVSAATTDAASATAPVTTRSSLVVKSLPRVETGAIAVTVKLLDRSRGLVPKNYDGEGGRCVWDYLGDFKYETAPPVAKRSGDDFVAMVKCDRANSHVTMSVTLWLPAKASAWLTDHEETHRAIAERVYSEGVTAIAEALKQVAGKTYETHGKSEAEATALASKGAMEEFNALFDKLFVARAKQLNDRFDSVTHHGLNRSKSNAEVVEMLFKEEKEGATTREEDH